MADPHPPFHPSGPGYSGAGIKTSLSGAVYQMELLMLVMNRGLRAGCTFKVATEVATAGAFDDIVFMYVTGKIKGALFFQAKHRTNLKKKIRKIDLTSVKGDFYVRKYFESYRRIITKREKEFESEGDMKHFVIYTPINIDDDILHNFEVVPLSHVFAENDFLCFDPILLPQRKPDNHPKFLKIREETDLYKDLVPLLTKNPERLKVAKRLGEMICRKKEIVVEHVFKEHHNWLLKKVLDGENVILIKNKHYIRFKKSFLSPAETEEDKELLEFREVLLQSYLDSQYKEDTRKENDKKDEVSERKHIIDILIKKDIRVSKTYLKSTYSKFQLNDITGTEIKSFFNQFVFATHQPNNDELKKIIQKEIGDMMNLVSDDSQWVECRLQSCVQDWLRAEKAHYVTNENCEAFFEYVKQKFAVCSQVSLSFDNVSHIEECGYTFSTGKLMRAIEDFLGGDGDPQILCVYYTNRLLTQIKLCQITRSYQDKKRNIIFGELKKLSRHIGSEMCPIKAFTSHLINYILLEINNCSNLCSKEKELLQKIIEIVNNDTKKRLVVMVSKDQQTPWENILGNCNNKSLSDSEYRFSDLNEESKEILKTATIRYNGRKFSVDTLLDKTLIDRLSSDVLCELVNDNMDLKSISADRHFDSHNYISRKFLRFDLVHKSVLYHPRVYVIDMSTFDNQDTNHTGNPKLQDKLNRTSIDKNNILVITESKYIFSRVCQRYINKNVIWVIKDSKEDLFRLQEYQGNLSDIHSFRVTKPCREIEDCILEHNHGKIILVTGDPGMGKSTLLSHIETNPARHFPGCFCIRTNLAEHFEDLAKHFENDMTKECIKFLYKAARLAKDPKYDIREHITVLENGNLELNADSRTITDELLRIAIFCHIYNEGNIVLLLDALDEISPDYDEQVIRLVKKLKLMKVSKILITSRPYDVARKIETEFNTISYIMEGLSVCEHRQLLLSYWTKLQIKTNVEISDIKVKEFLVLLEGTIFNDFRNNENDYISSFLSIPQHVAMFAKVVEERFLKFLTKKVNERNGEEFTEFTIYTLYDEYFKIKVQDKEPDYLNPRAKFNEKKEKVRIDNGKLAMLQLFGSFCEEFVSKDDRKKLLEQVMVGNQKTGFVSIVEGRPHFVHQTFAEFFAGDFLADAILDSEYTAKAKKILYEAIKAVPWHTYLVFKFFNYKIVSQHEYCSLFNAALNENIQKVVGNTADLKDKLGRTPFHLLFSSHLVSESTIINIYKDHKNDMLVADNLFKWTPLDYALSFHACYWKKYDIESQFRDIHGKTAYILALQRNCYEKCLISFFNKFPFVINVQDNTGKTSVHYIARTGYWRHSQYRFADNCKFKIPPDPSDVFVNELSEIISYLVRRGGYLNVQDNRGKTALHYAMENISRIELVNVLIKAGADVTIRNNSGRSPTCSDEHSSTSDLQLSFMNKTKPDVEDFVAEVWRPPFWCSHDHGDRSPRYLYL